MCKEVEDENDCGSGGRELRPTIAGIVCLKAIDQSGQHCYKTRVGLRDRRALEITVWDWANAGRWGESSVATERIYFLVSMGAVINSGISQHCNNVVC
jgi:hypothetical protein